MNKYAQQTNTSPSELIMLRNSIVKFHQNIKIVYNKLKISASQGAIQQAVFEAYKTYLESVAAASVFGPEFTTTQLKQHLRYLEGVVKKFASTNAMNQSNFTARYAKQPYYQNILYLGMKVKEIFIPAAKSIKSTWSDSDLIRNAKKASEILDKVGANFVTRISNYLDQITPYNNLGRVLSESSRISIEKLSHRINAYFRLTNEW